MKAPNGANVEVVAVEVVVEDAEEKAAAENGGAANVPNEAVGEKENAGVAEVVVVEVEEVEKAVVEEKADVKVEEKAELEGKVEVKVDEVVLNVDVLNAEVLPNVEAVVPNAEKAEVLKAERALKVEEPKAEVVKGEGLACALEVVVVVFEEKEPKEEGENGVVAGKVAEKVAVENEAGA